MNFADPLNIPGILVLAKTLSKEYMQRQTPDGIKSINNSYLYRKCLPGYFQGMQAS